MFLLSRSNSLSFNDIICSAGWIPAWFQLPGDFHSINYTPDLTPRHTEQRHQFASRNPSMSLNVLNHEPFLSDSINIVGTHVRFWPSESSVKLRAEMVDSTPSLPFGLDEAALMKLLQHSATFRRPFLDQAPGCLGVDPTLQKKLVQDHQMVERQGAVGPFFLVHECGKLQGGPAAMKDDADSL